MQFTKKNLDFLHFAKFLERIFGTRKKKYLKLYVKNSISWKKINFDKILVTNIQLS